MDVSSLMNFLLKMDRRLIIKGPDSEFTLTSRFTFHTSCKISTETAPTDPVFFASLTYRLQAEKSITIDILTRIFHDMIMKQLILSFIVYWDWNELRLEPTSEAVALLFVWKRTDLFVNMESYFIIHSLFPSIYRLSNKVFSKNLYFIGFNFLRLLNVLFKHFTRSPYKICAVKSYLTLKYILE